MKKCCSFALILLIITLFSGCGVFEKILSRIDFSSPKYSDTETIETIYGDVLEIIRVEHDFPDQEIYISVNCNQKNILFEVITNYLSYYSYKKDILDDWNKIIYSYQEDSVRLYQFNWGIVYTTDNGNSFMATLKHKYSDSYREDENFARVYGMIYSQPFYDEKYSSYLDTDRIDLVNAEDIQRLQGEVSLQGAVSILGKAPRYLGETISTNADGDIQKRDIFEYDLSDGKTLTIWFKHIGPIDNPRLYMYDTRIRDVPIS